MSRHPALLSRYSWWRGEQSNAPSGAASETSHGRAGSLAPHPPRSWPSYSGRAGSYTRHGWSAAPRGVRRQHLGRAPGSSGSPHDGNPVRQRTTLVVASRGNGNGLDRGGRKSPSCWLTSLVPSLNDALPSSFRPSAVFPCLVSSFAITSFISSSSVDESESSAAAPFSGATVIEESRPTGAGGASSATPSR